MSPQATRIHCRQGPVLPHWHCPLLGIDSSQLIKQVHLTRSASKRSKGGSRHKQTVKAIYGKIAQETNHRQQFYLNCNLMSTIDSYQHRVPTQGFNLDKCGLFQIDHNLLLRRAQSVYNTHNIYVYQQQQQQQQQEFTTIEVHVYAPYNRTSHLHARTRCNGA